MKWNKFVPQVLTMHLVWWWELKRGNPWEGFSSGTGLWDTFYTIRVTLPAGSGTEAEKGRTGSTNQADGGGVGRKQSKAKEGSFPLRQLSGVQDITWQGKCWGHRDEQMAEHDETTIVGTEVNSYPLYSKNPKQQTCSHIIGSHLFMSSEFTSTGFNQHCFFNKRYQNGIG